jgi:two-component system cell cycle sensor histidine kinase/response regulator CckA
VGIPLQVVTVLVVDDIRLARRIAVRILSEEGYRVLEADGADEALEVLSEARGRVDLVVLDVVMPKGDGVALTKSISAEWPDQRLLYMSAHPAEILARHGLEDLNVPFLAKPYTRVELLAMV